MKKAVLTIGFAFAMFSTQSALANARQSDPMFGKGKTCGQAGINAEVQCTNWFVPGRNHKTTLVSEELVTDGECLVEVICWEGWTPEVIGDP